MSKESQAVAAAALIERLLPGRAREFSFERIAAADGPDVFEVEADGGAVSVRGSSGVAMAAGAYRYLRQVCRCQATWCGDQLALPDRLPSTPALRGESPYRHRVCFNYCTFSYTMAWWDWARWEREIDWMALHGVNMPLAVVGQESVWQATLRRFGLTDRQIAEFFVGPAFFAWQWMNNIEGWQGPLPQSWIDSHAALGRRILTRQRELGMTPILQGFVGYLPKAMTATHPAARIDIKKDWFGAGTTAQLDPLDPLFGEMGRAFIQEQTRLFGTDHYYAADPFHEGAPPQDTPDYMPAVSRAIFQAMADADPQAVWVMQSWSMREELVRPVPPGRLLLLDINGGRWPHFGAFAERPWVWGVLHNYGGRVFLGGNLQALAAMPRSVTDPAKAAQLAGVGMFPEAIEHNPALYELATDLAWTREPIDLAGWLDRWVRCRYGADSPAARAAWQVLAETVYSDIDTPSFESTLCARPALLVKQAAPNGHMERRYDPARLREAWKLLLDCADSLADRPTYRYDLVDVGRQVLADLSLPFQRAMADAFRAGDLANFDRHAEAFVGLALDADVLLGTCRHFLLGAWLSAARAWGRTPAEADFYERNARTLVTVWGPMHDDALLFDYSNRQWSGLIGGFYLHRWRMFIAFLRGLLAAGTPYDESGLRDAYSRPANDANDFYRRLADWELAWTSGHETYPADPSGDPIEISRRLFRKYLPPAPPPS